MGETTDATRQALVAAAAEVFAEKGYERAGVAEIARRAGLTTGAIYSNFSGKAELLLEAIDVRAEGEFEQLFNEHRFQGRATDILQTVGAHLVSPDSHAGDSHLLLEAITTARRDPEMAAMLAARIEARAARMAALIEEAKLDGTIAEDLDTLALVRFCHAVSLGMLNLKALSLDLPEPQPWGDLIAQLVGALAPPTVDLTTEGALTHDRDCDRDLIDRDAVNDVDAILDVTPTDMNEVIHAVQDNADAVFTWDYEKGQRPALNKLYEKAKTSQWNGETDLDWSIEVDPAKVLVGLGGGEGDPRFGRGGLLAQDPNLPFHKFGDKEWEELRTESTVWRLSQFMHGEQGALLCTAKIVETVPWIDAKYYASTQVMDEARHVEVFAKYLDTKLDGFYPVNGHLRVLLDDIIQDSRWDMTYLGMQIMVEGLALAAFGFMYQLTEEPLLKKLLRYVMSDEARHVAFGVLSLKEFYEDLSAAELRERQEFAFEAAVRMRDRFLQQEVWERMGIPVKPMLSALLTLPQDENVFQSMLFSKIVPNCKKLGLLDASDGWLRDRFTEIGVIQFEDWVDTGAEYEALDEVAKDREAVAS